VSKAKILMVDDNPGNMKLLSFILGKQGYDVRVAGDAEQALSVLKEFRPRLILMDVQLPGMDGLELTRRLKADPAYGDVVIIAVTASAMKGDEQEALAAGCDGYITKPIDTRLMPVLVARYLETPRQPQ
jgi:CheY-like chemotaxis protein